MGPQGGGESLQASRRDRLPATTQQCRVLRVMEVVEVVRVVRWVIQTVASAQLISQQIKQCASQLVRLALFYEYQRKVIRRDLIFQKGKPNNGTGS